ncbi:MAG: decarboxylating 6-phosphogluconate dehydrogenase [Candidatus Eremiobacteraeota bacterium]|nr:decarboxylating 6-phosphogluconate dehydrogenase [Candidatus Eremiobacteraeota bacterium]
MQVGMVGLGKMGANMVQRLLQGKHEVSAYDRDPEAVKKSAADGATGCDSLESLVRSLKHPRAVWIMVPSGDPTHETIAQLQTLLQEGDVVIDGGNSYWKDGQEQARKLGSAGVSFIDAGVSGGIWGLKEGYCLMVGGDEQMCRRLEPIFLTLAPADGYLRVGPVGAGHFVKMVHNGVEYGMLQAYGEGFEMLAASPFGAGLDLQRISHLWNQGSVVRSWLLELAERAFAQDRNLEGIEGYVDDTGEGRWTVEDAIDFSVPVPALALSLFMRFRSRQTDSFSAKVIAALRNQFGGHAVHGEPAAAPSPDRQA